MNGYTMALPHCPIPNMFTLSCGPRVVYGPPANVPDNVEENQTPTYTTSKRIKQESDHSRCSFPSSPPAGTMPPESRHDFSSYQDRSPGARKMHDHRESWQISPTMKSEKSRVFSNNNNNNNNTHNHNISHARLSEGVSEISSSASKDNKRHCDTSSTTDLLPKGESECGSPLRDCHSNIHSGCANIKEEGEENDNDKEQIGDSTNSCNDRQNSVSPHRNQHLISHRSPVPQSLSSSTPPPLVSYPIVSTLPTESSSPFPSSSPLISSSSLPSSSLLTLPSSIKQEKRLEDSDSYSPDDNADDESKNNENVDDGRSSRLSCIVDIERDTPPTSPVTSPSPSHSPLNLSKSCLDSSQAGSDANRPQDTPTGNSELVLKPYRETFKRRQSQNDDIRERQSEDEQTKRRRRTNFSIDAILSSKFGGVSPSIGEHEHGSPDTSCNDRVNPPQIIHSENSAFSAVDLRVKANHSSASMSPSSNLSSAPPSPQLFSSPLTRSPPDSSLTEDENFNKGVSNPIAQPLHNPFAHLLKIAPPSRDSNCSIEDVLNDSKNNNPNSIHPFQRFYPTVFPSHFPAPKHGSSAPDMEEFFHRNFPLFNQAYSHLMGKFPFMYMPPEQNFPLHSISKMHPDPNSLFDPTRVFAVPHNNAIHPDRTPLMHGSANNPRFHSNFPNAKECLAENINPKPSRPLMNNYNSNNIASFKSSSLNHPKSQLSANGGRINSILPPVPHLQMDQKLAMPRSKSKESTAQKASSKTLSSLDMQVDKSLENKNDVTKSETDQISSSDGQDSMSKQDLEAEKDKNTLWPAWVFCTRYSDRPSSGPRSRKPKRKASVDEKRPRTAFTNDQLQRLKREFEDCRYLTETRRRSLASELGLSESQIKIWFQNKRAKIKKSVGVKNTLAMKLMEEGLYNHSTIKMGDESS